MWKDVAVRGADAPQNSPAPRPSLDRYRPKPFFGSSHWWAIERIAALPRSAAILDIGSGSGVIGQTLRERGFADIFAVEVDAPSVIATRPNYARIEGSLAAFAGMSFDAVLLLDVLEHVESPRALLAQALSVLRPGGLALISVPNIGHWSARLPVALGFRRLTDRGILDRTHRHFFTRQRILDLIETIPNTSVLEVAGSISPAEFVAPNALCRSRFFRWLSSLRWRIAQRVPGIAAYQHLVRLSLRAGGDGGVTTPSPR